MSGSAVARISTVLGDIADAISSLSGETTSLISKAEAALEYESIFPLRGEMVITSTDYKPDYQKADFIEGMPILIAPQLPEPPDYKSGPIAGPPGAGGPIKSVEVLPFAPTPIGPPVPPSPAPALVYSVDEPDVSPPPLPPPPDTTSDVSLQLLTLERLTQELTLTLPTVAWLDVGADDLTLLDYRAEAKTIEGYTDNGIYGIPGVSHLNETAQDITEHLLNSVSPVLLDEVRQRFEQPMATVNATKETLLAQLAETQWAEIQAIQTQALAHLTDQSGWDLPEPVRRAIQQQAEQWIDSWKAHVAAQRRTQIMDHAQKMVVFCSEIYLDLREAVENLRMQEFKAVIEAHQSAVEYAKKQSSLLLKLFDLENYRQYDLDLKRAEVAVRLFEEQLKADYVRYDFVRGQIEAEQLQQTVNAALVQQYDAEVRALAARTQLVEQQLDAAKKEVELRKLPVELFREQVGNFQAMVDAEEANLGKMLAEIEQQDLLRDVELTKIKTYDTKIKASESLFSAKQGSLESTKAANRAKLDAYEGTAKAAALPVEYSLLNAQYQLYAHEINAGNYMADAELALKFKQMDFDYLKQKREMREGLLRDLRELSLDMAKTEIERKQAVAEVAIQCANVLASMAEGAMSAGNLVASATIEELA
jgi:hypothetical protein